MSEHQAFMQAVNDKDVQRASMLMRDHVLRTGFLVGEFVSGRIDASPDMLSLAPEPAQPARNARAGKAENVLGGFRLGDMDVEIAMPVQTLQDLSGGTGLWRGTDAGRRRRQLAHMAATCAEAYPTLRLHLYDGRETFAAPFTILGRIRAALYLGEAYLVVSSAEQVAALTRLFDNLVRRATIGPDRVHETLADLAGQVA